MNQKRKKQYLLVWCLMGSILIIDQVVKILVKTNMHIGEEIPLIGNWCMLHFVENEGFAFGMAFGGSTGKIILSLFRLVASGALLWFLLRPHHVAGCLHCLGRVEACQQFFFYCVDYFARCVVLTHCAIFFCLVCVEYRLTVRVFSRQ